MENEIENPKQLEVVQSIKSHNPSLFHFCYLVGEWIWAEFPQKPSQEEIGFLKSLGFRWNPARRVWQNACGLKTRMSSGDPRKKYQIIHFEE